MRARTIRALEAPHKGVRGTGGPHAVEFGSIPGGFEGYLGHADRVRGRAGRGVHEAIGADGVVHVGLVVGGVEVHAVPAAVELGQYIAYTEDCNLRLDGVVGKKKKRKSPTRGNVESQKYRPCRALSGNQESQVLDYFQ